jgi:hypothetical protein
VPSAAAALLRAAAARARAASDLLRALLAGRAEEGRPILGSADSARARKPISASALAAALSSARRVACEHAVAERLDARGGGEANPNPNPNPNTRTRTRTRTLSLTLSVAEGGWARGVAGRIRGR